MSYQYPKTTSQVDVCRNIFINALEGPRAEKGKPRQTKHLQDHLRQDIWWFLCQICQMIGKFTTQLLTLCLLVFMIWMLGLFVIASSVLNTAVTPRPRRIVSPSSTKPKYQFFNSVISARNHQPKSQPFFQRQTNIPILELCRISPRSSTNTYVNSILSARNHHQKIHTLERSLDEELRRVAFCRKWNLQ